MFVFGPAMFLLYHSEGCNTWGAMFCKCYVNDLHTTTCSAMLGHRRRCGQNFSDVKASDAPSWG
jgi:hypothetical protein